MSQMFTNMTTLNKAGISFILYLQDLPIFSGHWETFWLCCTKLGDPSWVFIVFIPLLSPLLGQNIIQFLIAGAISEFLNGVFKWILFSDRPYWWIHESNAYSNIPPLKQFPLTCETGPGSPSGHAMVSSCVWLIFIMNLTFKRIGLNYMKWIIYVIFLFLVGISRLYIGTHFPHQVLLGVVCGVTIALTVHQMSFNRFKFRFCLFLSLSLLFLAAVTFISITLLGLDPNWSIGLAMKHCNKSEWIHLSTTPLASLFRDIGALLGLGVASEMKDFDKIFWNEYSGFTKTVQGSILGLIVAQFTFVCFPNVDSLVLFYGLTCIQHFIIAFTLLYVLPKFLNETSVVNKSS